MNDEIYVVVADNDKTVWTKNMAYDDPGGPLVFEQYANVATLENIRTRAGSLSRRYGVCRIAKLVFTGESYFNGKKVQSVDPLVWECKYCGENDKPLCHKCVRTDGKTVEDSIL